MSGVKTHKMTTRHTTVASVYLCYQLMLTSRADCNRASSFAVRSDLFNLFDGGVGGCVEDCDETDLAVSGPRCGVVETERSEERHNVDTDLAPPTCVAPPSGKRNTPRSAVAWPSPEPKATPRAMRCPIVCRTTPHSARDGWGRRCRTRLHVGCDTNHAQSIMPSMPG